MDGTTFTFCKECPDKLECVRRGVCSEHPGRTGQPYEKKETENSDLKFRRDNPDDDDD